MANRLESRLILLLSGLDQTVILQPFHTKIWFLQLLQVTSAYL